MTKSVPNTCISQCDLADFRGSGGRSDEISDGMPGPRSAFHSMIWQISGGAAGGVTKLVTKCRGREVHFTV